MQDGGYVAVTDEKMVKITPGAEGGYIFHCTYDDFRDVWVAYFDLCEDYEAYQQKMSGDPFLRAAIAAGGGIRILRQDLWEMVVTFVISQRNNIPRIRKAVDILCQTFGTPLGEIDGQTFYSFPTPEQLRGQDLSAASLGYRESYIKELAELDAGIWREIRGQDEETARKSLLSIRGVGEKVANCVMLFGLHCMDSYPRDVWINRMISDIYHGDFDPTQYAGFAGYVQQLQFFYYRMAVKEDDA
jgi:N-glycosylase/DNA lyase